ncbi:MAG TPA: hypothetical protein VGD65_01925 [Chryseosolibacter sp.]
MFVKKFLPNLMVIAIIMVASPAALSQDDDKTLFQKYFTDCNAGRSADVPKEVSTESKRAKYWLNSLESSLLKTGKSSVCATDAILDIARYDKENKSVGRIAVNLLTTKLEQGGLNDYIIDRMDDLPSNFFLEIHKQRIHALAQKKETAHRDKMIDLLTLLNYEPGYTLAYTELQNPNLSKAKLFKYHAVFAKRGHEPSIAWLTQQIEGRKVDQQALYGVVPHLLATRQKSLVQWVVDGLYESENLCSSSDDRKGHCGVLILEQLAPVIKDFPIQADESGLIAENDADALETAKAWFKNNPNYSMVK